MKTVKFIVYNLPDNLRLMHPQPKADKCYKDERIATFRFVLWKNGEEKDIWKEERCTMIATGIVVPRCVLDLPSFRLPVPIRILAIKGC